jgi:hypothetical protein
MLMLSLVRALRNVIFSGFELFGRLRLIRVDQLVVGLWPLAACRGNFSCLWFLELLLGVSNNGDLKQSRAHICANERVRKMEKRNEKPP